MTDVKSAPLSGNPVFIADESFSNESVATVLGHATKVSAVCPLEAVAPAFSNSLGKGGNSSLKHCSKLPTSVRGCVLTAGSVADFFLASGCGLSKL